MTAKQPPATTREWNKRLRSPVPWYGGKFYQAKRIIQEFPEHRSYLEPFGGGASILLCKKPSLIETYNDLDQRISRLFRVLRDQGKEFIRMVKLIPYSQADFNSALKYENATNDLDLAVADFVRWRQSFSGMGQHWSYSKNVSRNGMAGNVHTWQSAIEWLPEVIERLKRVQISCKPATEAIKRFDNQDALIYCDPPYVHSTRTRYSKSVYGKEMSDHDHEELAKALNRAKGKVILSGYPSKLYDQLYAGWRTVTFEVSQHASSERKKRRVCECLWMNF